MNSGMDVTTGIRIANDINVITSTWDSTVWTSWPYIIGRVRVPG